MQGPAHFLGTPRAAFGPPSHLLYPLNTHSRLTKSLILMLYRFLCRISAATAACNQLTLMTLLRGESLSVCTSYIGRNRHQQQKSYLVRRLG